MRKIMLFEDFQKNNDYVTRTVSVSEEQIIKLIEDNCSDWDFFSENQLHRQYDKKKFMFKDELKYMIVDPQLNKRRSVANSSDSNVIYHHANIHPSWKDYERDNIVIASSKKREAIFADNNYIMIPFNNARINVTGSVDFNIRSALFMIELFSKEDLKSLGFDDNDRSFFPRLSDLLNSNFNDIARFFTYAIPIKWYDVEYYKLIQKSKLLNNTPADVTLDKDVYIDKYGKNGYTIFSLIWKLYDQYKNKFGWKTLYDMFVYVMSPENNGFANFKSGDIQKKSSIFNETREIYTNSKCLLIQEDFFDELKEILLKKKKKA
jgi:hypothetical protein